LRKEPDKGIDCEYAVPADAFMAVELQAGAFFGKSGTVPYSAVYSDL
jgi:predicted N-acetyltransferase YhbS